MLNRKQITNKKLTIEGVQIPLIFAIFIGLISALIVFFSIEASVKGSQLAQLEEEYAQLTKQNEDINQQLISRSSLTALYKSAEDMGYIKPSSIVYIKPPEALAKLP